MRKITAEEANAMVAEKYFGYHWVQPPKFDYDGPLPEQGLTLVSPTLAACIHSGEYKWPPKGIIGRYLGIPDYIGSDADNAQLRRKLGERFFWVLKNYDADKYGFDLFTRSRVDDLPETLVHWSLGSDERKAIVLCALKAAGEEVEIGD